MSECNVLNVRLESSVKSSGTLCGKMSVIISKILSILLKMSFGVSVFCDISWLSMVIEAQMDSFSFWFRMNVLHLLASQIRKSRGFFRVACSWRLVERRSSRPKDRIWVQWVQRQLQAAQDYRHTSNWKCSDWQLLVTIVPRRHILKVLRKTAQPLTPLETLFLRNWQPTMATLASLICLTRSTGKRLNVVSSSTWWLLVRTNFFTNCSYYWFPLQISRSCEVFTCLMLHRWISVVISVLSSVTSFGTLAVFLICFCFFIVQASRDWERRHCSTHSSSLICMPMNLRLLGNVWRRLSAWSLPVWY